MLDEHTFGVRPVQPERGLRIWYRQNRAALLAAAWFWVLFLVLAALTLFTGWSSRPVTLFLEMIVSLGAGILAAWLHRREQPLAPRYVRMGTLAGFYLPLTTAVAITLIALAAGLASLGTLLPLMIPYFVFLPVELGVCSLLGAFGAWLFKLFVRG